MRRSQVKGYVALVADLAKVVAQELRYSRDVFAADGIRHEFSQFAYRVSGVYPATLIGRERLGTIADYVFRQRGLLSNTTTALVAGPLHSAKLLSHVRPQITS